MVSKEKETKMIEFEKGYNPYNKLKSFDEELTIYYEIRVSYGNYDYDENNTIEKAQFASMKDCIAYIKHDKQTCKELNEPKVYFILTKNEWCKEEDCYYYDEFEVHFHKNGNIFLKAI